MHRVVAFNCAAHRDRLAELSRGLPVETSHVDYQLPWQAVAARRAGVVADAEPVAPAVRAVLAPAEVVFGFALPARLTALAPRLRWVETPATGYDQLFGTGVLDGEIAVTTVGGLFAPWVAEHVFALLFALARRLGHFRAAQERREWSPAVVRELHGATIGIVGLGNIGQAVARAAQAFGMRVIGVRRRVEPVPAVDRVYGSEALDEMLAAADVVVIAVTGTAETASMIGARQLEVMKRDAYLVNVARGIVLDEAALAAALARGHLGGAALDAFVDEPLPPASPLWSLPNVIVTPHIAPNVGAKLARCVEHFADNLVRFCNGEPLRDQVRLAAATRCAAGSAPR